MSYRVHNTRLFTWVLVFVLAGAAAGMVCTPGVSFGVSDTRRVEGGGSGNKLPDQRPSLPDRVQYRIERALTQTGPNALELPAVSGNSESPTLSGSATSHSSDPLEILAISVGDRVQTNDVVNVRQAPAGTILGTQPLGRQGTVTGGPTTASLNGTPFTWFNVNFDSGVDGWVADIGLVLVKCDIVVQGTPGISPNPVTAGNNITVSYVIHNNGPGNAGTSQTKIQIKNSSGTPITAPTFSAPAISGGANSPTQSSSVSIPAGTAAGTYTAFVILDNQGQLNQSNTSNDFTPGVNFTVSVAPQQCDIVVQGTPAIAPNPVTAGNNITVSYVIHNNGPGNAGTSQTKIQIKNSSGTPITAPTFAAPAISGGANSPTQSSSVSIPAGTAAGTYTAFVILDNQGQLNQSNTSNDFTPGVNFTVSVTPQQCDIVVQGTPAIAPNPVTAGNNITVSYVIHNNGPGNAGASQTKIQIKNSSGTPITAPTFSAPAISGGANSPTQSSSVSIPAGTAAGTYTAFVILDNQNELNQTDRNNDLTPGVNFTVSGPGQLPNLAPQSIALNKTSLQPGESLLINWTLANVGDGNSPGTVTGVRLNQSPNNGNTQPFTSFPNVSMPALSAHSSTPQSTTITIPGSVLPVPTTYGSLLIM